MKLKSGFSLIELLIVMGLVGILFSLGTLSLANYNKQDQLDSISAEIKLAIMQSQSQTVNGHPSGVYIGNTNFTVFFTDQFEPGNLNNLVFDLPSGITFQNINLPENQINFLKVSGYVKNYSPPENFTLHDQETGRTKVFNLNRLGVITTQ